MRVTVCRRVRHRIPLRDRRVAADRPQAKVAGVRTSTQMSFGVAAIAAYALGPGLGGYIFTGLAQVGGANALNYALVGTIGVVILALVLDLVLVGVGRLTISRGIRA